MEMWHLALTRDWESALGAGEYRVSTLGATLDDVGFIHCSRPHQAPGVAERFYTRVFEPLSILVLDDDAMRAAGVEVRDEDAGGGEFFPHIYGPIDPSLVRKVLPARIADGQLVVE